MPMVAGKVSIALLVDCPLTIIDHQEISLVGCDSLNDVKKSFR